MNTAELVNAYVRYKTKRAKIKIRQRAEMEAELRPLMSSLGAEITAARKGITMEQIKTVIGNRNGNFLYDCIALHVADVKPEERLADPDSEADWQITPGNNPYEFSVTVYGAEYVILCTEAGIPISPAEWAGHSREKRLTYKEILRDIRALVDDEA